MKKQLLLLSIILPFFVQAQLNGSLVISGTVTSENGSPLAGATIQVKNAATAVIADNSGKFQIIAPSKFPFVLQVSFVGFTTQEIEIRKADAKVSVQLPTNTIVADQVVVTASRVPESILKSPVSIEKLDVRALKETPAASFYDALGNVKGVQLTTSSLTFKIPNTRGFNIPNNFRFMQLVDGVDMQAATLGVPLGNAIGPTELDIQSIEITPGAASALYGLNAINGMANLITKNSFTSQGLSFFQRTGVNHVDGIDHAPSVLSETAIRYAKAFNDKFAFKLNFGYMTGTDWVSDNRTDQNTNDRNTANPLYPELNNNNPASDLWNRYGDENNNAVTINGVNYNGNNKTFILRRTGYYENELVQPKVDNIKFDGELAYKLFPELQLSYGYRIGKMDGVFQRGNKIQLDDVIVQNHKLELKGKNFLVRSYVSIENTGKSYNLKPLADNLQLTQSSNSVWGNKFKTALQAALDNGNDLATAMDLARIIADNGRVEPGTVAFNALKDTITGINNWDHINAGIVGAPSTGGAFLKQKSRIYHTDFQYDFLDKIKFANVLVGADLRIYEVIPDGNNFVDFKRPIAERNSPLKDGSFGENIYYKKYGAFVQLTKTLLDEKLKLFASLRFDHNLEFSPKLNPRVAAVYTLNKLHNFRISYQNGFRFPALFEALSFVNNGNVRRVGGLSYINEGLGYLENSYTLESVNTFNAAVNKDITAGSTPNDAALKNRSLLTATSLSSTRPEKINSFEIGYKSIVANNKIIIDADAYYNIYDGFLGQVEVSVPENNAVVIGSDQAIIDMLAANRSKQTRYRVYTNGKNKYHNFGTSAGITYNFYKTFTVSGNVSFNKIQENKTKDVFVTAFNTPAWTTNISIGNRALTNHLGFNIVWKWQDAFLWESPLAVGTVPGFNIFDAQITYRLPRMHSIIKAGGANIFNQRYIQYAAGPTIGGLYYVTVTIENLLND